MIEARAALGIVSTSVFSASTRFSQIQSARLHTGETPTKGRWVKREGAAVATALPSYAIDWVAPEVSKFQKAAPEEAKPTTKH